MSETDSSTIGRVKSLVMPILTDLKLDLYDLEYRGGVVRVTVDRPAVAVPAAGPTKQPEQPRRAPRKPHAAASISR